jgi:uncharacterized protein
MLYRGGGHQATVEKDLARMRTTARRRRHQLPPEVEAALNELKQALTQLYGDRLQGVYLYGSYARGDFTEGSDVDVLVALEGEFTRGEETARYNDAVSDICLRYDILIATSPVAADWVTHRRSPFFDNVRKEAVRL